MRLTESVQSITVQEATVGEVRRWVAGLETARPVSIVDAVPWGGTTLTEIKLFVDPDQHADLDGLTPSELADVAAAAERINPDFFVLRAMLFPVQPPGPASPATPPDPSSETPSG